MNANRNTNPVRNRIMNGSFELLQILRMIDYVGRNRPTTNTMNALFGIDKTGSHLDHAVEYARHLGAELYTHGEHWAVDNWDRINSRGILAKWIAAERARRDELEAGQTIDPDEEDALPDGRFVPDLDNESFGHSE